MAAVISEEKEDKGNVKLSTLEISMTESKTNEASRLSNDNLSGYLYKKTKDGRWQKRWFESNGSFLAYYKSKKKEKLLAALSLPQTGEIRLVNNDSGNASQAGLFSIELNSRVYILQAKTDEEGQLWVKTLNNLKYQGYPNLRSGDNSVRAGRSSIQQEINDVMSSADAESKGEWKKSNRRCCGCC